MEQERPRLEVDALFVGGGPASLAGALRLTQLVAAHNDGVERGALPGPALEPEIAVIEKGRDAGVHAISGAILDCGAVEELLPDYRDRGFPFTVPVREPGLYFLTTNGRYRVPEWSLPRGFRHQGCYVGSLQRLNLWLAEQLEAAGAYLFPETCGVEVLYDGDRVRGIRTGDKGLETGGGRKPNYEPGTLIEARVTVFGEGPHGTLAEDLIDRFRLREGRQPQSYALGVKELIRVDGDGAPGLAVHTFGYPLGSRNFGGGFCYGLDDSLFSVGMVCALDWQDPRTDVQDLLQQLKKHPLIQRWIRGGEVVSYGAKTIPEGGYFAIPRLSVDGGLLIGDTAGLLNVPYLKGIHYAMKSGMLAAETIYEALVRNDASATVLRGYEQRVDRSYIGRDLYRVRSFRRAFALGRWPGMILGGLGLWTGLGPAKPGRVSPDYRHLQPTEDRGPVREPSGYDPGVLQDKLSDLFHSHTEHREDQPSHIRIVDPDRCISECVPRFGDAPCAHFCPANVYELVGEGDERRIQVNFSNCVHCKTCVIKDPLDVEDGDNVQNIVWRAPAEGGPRYRGL